VTRYFGAVRLARPNRIIIIHKNKNKNKNNKNNKNKNNKNNKNKNNKNNIIQYRLYFYFLLVVYNNVYSNPEKKIQNV
jgi:hypothetical protein